MQAIGSFLVLTFGVTWTLWALVFRISAAHAPAHVPSGLAVGGPLFLVGVFAPGIVAVALTRGRDGRDAVGRLLRDIGRWRVGIGFYVFALFFVPVIKLTAAGCYRLSVGTWPAFGATSPLVLLLAMMASTLVQAGEEVGWRGYLLPRLAARMGLVAASLVVGAIWAVWHLPLFFVPGADTNGQSFPLYMAQVIAYSVVLAWLYWRTGGSLLLPMMLHAAFNNLSGIVPSGTVPAGSPFAFNTTLMSRVTVTLLWVVGLVLLLRMRGVRRIGGAFERRDSPHAA